MDKQELLYKLKDDSIENLELENCLKTKDSVITGLAIFKIIERKYSNSNILNMLSKIALLLENAKFIGPYQFGHLATASLYLLNNVKSLEFFYVLYENLNVNDKYLVDNFIKEYKYN